MTAQEVLLWLRDKPFRAFRVTMNNGYTMDVAHPELAKISATGTLYVYEPSDGEQGGLIACDMRNICTLTRLSTSQVQPSS